jgi:hypothetical protein
MNLLLCDDLKEVLDLLKSGEHVSDKWQADAVAAQVMHGWVPDDFRFTLAHGVPEIDIDYAREIILEFGLPCSLPDVRDSIMRRCEEKRRIA